MSAVISKLVSPKGTPINPIGTGKMINLFGEGETEPGFVNYTTDPKFAIGNNGTPRPWTGDPERPPGLEDHCASDICIRLAPLSKLTLEEVERIAMPGCRVTIAVHSGPDDDRPGGTNSRLQRFRDWFPTCTRLFDGVHAGVTDVGALMDWKVIVAELPATPRARVVAAPPTLPREITNCLGMTFRWIPAGSLRLGVPDHPAAGPDELGAVRELTVGQSFYLGIHPVTQEQYEKVMGGNPSYFSSTGGGKDRVRGLDTRSFPVEQVSWHDAQKFVEGLSALLQEKEKGRRYRLPQEVEWEYACRGGATCQPFYFGSSLSSRQANFDGRYPYGAADPGPYLGRTSPVGSYPANGFGLFDMHGNVYEWCQDWSRVDCHFRSPRDQPPFPIRAIRGGGWNDSGDCCGASSRSGIAPSNRGFDLGFRVVLVLQEENLLPPRADRLDLSGPRHTS